ncbi:MAG: zinc ribbon domain-containing protein, partial [Victivallales bacterium]
MLIKCNSCGHDNQLGAIFCRGCGDKLDVETMRPKVMEAKASSTGVGGLIRNLIGFLIFLGLAGVIVMMFYPQDLSVYPALGGEEAIKTAKAKYDAMLKKADTGFGNDSYSFSPEEATYLYNELFVAKVPTDSSSYNIEKLIFSADPVGFTHIIMKTKLAGKLPATFEISGSIVNSDTKEKDK